MLPKWLKVQQVSPRLMKKMQFHAICFDALMKVGRDFSHLNLQYLTTLQQDPSAKAVNLFC
jgi:hypothetical protein